MYYDREHCVIVGDFGGKRDVLRWQGARGPIELRVENGEGNAACVDGSTGN